MIKVTYKTIMFLLWSGVVYLICITTPHMKDLYIFLTITSFPSSFIGTYIIDSISHSFLVIVLVQYLCGLFQWVFIVGGLMDKFLAQIKIEKDI